jgi:Ca2+-binding RTX toxin-like protein
MTNFLRRSAAIVALLAVLLMVAAVRGDSVGMPVPATKLSDTQTPRTVTQLRPTECAAVAVTALLTGAGALTGTNASELLLGGTAAQTIRGLGGADCLVGAGGDDTLNGGTGTDVCVGGPGTDTFTGCETQIQ